MKLSASRLQPVPLMLAQFAGWAAVVAIAVLSLVPGSVRPHVMSADKAEHFFAYFTVGILFVLGYHRITLILIGVPLMLYAAVLETAQLLVPDRGGSIADFTWGAFGVWCGIAMAQPVRWLARQLRWPMSKIG